MAQHKWHKEIKAWADGAEIEYRTFDEDTNNWTEWQHWSSPNDTSIAFIKEKGFEYRIKPQPKDPQYKSEDRFDMEQKIINFGSILDDLKLVNDHIGDDRIDALIKLYQLKYDDLWNCFEKVIENGTT